MANTKISALTAATTPLAGTEVLPVVQSSTTKQVSVANLTAGRAVSMLSGTATNSFLVGNATGAKYSRIQSTGNGAQVNLDIWGKTGAGVDAGFSIGIGITGDKGLEFQDNATGVVRAELAQAGNLKLNSGNLVQGTAAKGFNFTANTAAAGMTSQLLNWYEEGTFTPTIILGGGSVTYTTQTGSYTRIGRLVTVQINLVVNVATTPSSTLEIGGMPFTIAATTKGAASILASGMTASATTTWMGSATPSTSVLRLYTYSAGNLANPGAYLANGCQIAITCSYEV
jgi:hypothetical protein